MILRYAHQDFFPFLFASETSTDILSFCIAGTCSSRRCSSRHTLLFIWTTPRLYSGQHGTEDMDWPLFTVFLLLGLTRSWASSADLPRRPIWNGQEHPGVSCWLLQALLWVHLYERSMISQGCMAAVSLTKVAIGSGGMTEPCTTMLKDPRIAACHASDLVTGDWQSFRGRFGGCAEVIQTGEMRRADVQAICAASY